MARVVQSRHGGSYFLLSVSTPENLQLCISHALAGFSNSINGVWAYLDVQEGDFCSFLYGARAHNLYRVRKKKAFREADKLPPWDLITFRESGRTYYFPFRLYLEQIRRFEEPLVRAEFAYVAENLLLRGGYRKTHFQADQTTLQNVSQMGEVWKVQGKQLAMPGAETFVPRFTRRRHDVNPPEVYQLRETILQTAIRYHLSDGIRLAEFTKWLEMDIEADCLEVLSEKALPQGHVDILLKEAIPIGRAAKVPIEVKLGRANRRSLEQLKGYRSEFGAECIATVLIAEEFSRGLIKAATEMSITLVKYRLNIDWTAPKPFDEIVSNLQLERIA